MDVILIIVALLIFILIINSTINLFYFLSTKKKLNKELLIEQTKIKAILIERKYVKLKLNGKLDDLPYITRYLDNSSKLLDEGGLNFENVHIQPIGKDEEFAKGLIADIEKVYTNKEKAIKNLFYREIELADQVFRIKHPVKFKINKLKKNIMVQILKYKLKKMDNRKKKVFENKKLPEKLLYENELSVEIKSNHAVSAA